MKTKTTKKKEGPREMIVTGIDPKKLSKLIESDKKGFGQCYVCKRKAKEKVGVIFSNGGEEVGVASFDVSLYTLDVEVDGTRVEYPICNNCHAILSCLAREAFKDIGNRVIGEKILLGMLKEEAKESSEACSHEPHRIAA